MNMFARLTTAALLAGGIVAPAMAQYPAPYPSPYPQTYPPGYAYQGQGYNNGGGIGQIGHAQAAPSHLVFISRTDAA